MLKNEKTNVQFFLKDLLTLNLYALHAITMHKLKIMCKDIGNFKKNCIQIVNYVKKYWKFEKNYCNQNLLQVSSKVTVFKIYLSNSNFVKKLLKYYL